jgi:Cu(I)/Ag(I) efflux system periplasmic protein CusF
MRSISKRWQVAALIALALGVVSGADAQIQERPVGEAEGVVKAVDASEHKLMITHGPISGGIQMPGMTMSFQVAPDLDLSKLEKGEKIKFTVTRDEKGRYLITTVNPEK